MKLAVRHESDRHNYREKQPLYFKAKYLPCPNIAFNIIIETNTTMNTSFNKVLNDL